MIRVSLCLFVLLVLAVPAAGQNVPSTVQQRRRQRREPPPTPAAAPKPAAAPATQPVAAAPPAGTTTVVVPPPTGLPAEAPGEDIELYKCRQFKPDEKIKVTLKPDTSLTDLVAWVMGFTCK